MTTTTIEQVLATATRPFVVVSAVWRVWETTNVVVRSALVRMMIRCCLVVGRCICVDQTRRERICFF